MFSGVDKIRPSANKIPNDCTTIITIISDYESLVIIIQIVAVTVDGGLL